MGGRRLIWKASCIAQHISVTFYVSPTDMHSSSVSFTAPSVFVEHDNCSLLKQTQEGEALTLNW
jgi:hypothetical protein